MSAEQLNLFCWIVGDDEHDAFPIKIHSSKSVYALKKAIKENQHPKFDNFDTVKLCLWRVSLPGQGFIDRAMRTIQDQSPLNPASRLSAIFAGEIPGDIHIIVQPPPLTPAPETRLPPNLERFIRMFPPPASSQVAGPSQLMALQTDGEISRPPSATIPITLLHPFFNLFLDDCQSLQPTKEDNSLALEVSSRMSFFYANVKARQTELINLLGRYNLHFAPAEIMGTEYTMLSEMRCNGYPCVIIEIKHGMSFMGTEPIYQAARYYSAHLKQQQQDVNMRACYPCLILYLSGTTVSFAGIIYTTRPNIQELGPAIQLNYHHADIQNRKMAARYFGALRIATHRLRAYYATELPELDRLSPDDRADPNLPCYSVYTCLATQVKRNITYSSQATSGNLVFFGKSDEADVCVKFVRTYSKEAHELCGNMGIAPQLRGFERLPDGWLMVVMDRIDLEFVSLYMDVSGPSAEIHELVEEKITELHRAGYVHGDLRDTNIMVRRDGHAGFMLVDFDWAGKIGEVRYPTNVNRGPDLWRPDGVYDDELIRAEHDMEMVENMFFQA